MSLADLPEDLGAVILAGGQSRRMAAHPEIAQRHGAKFLLETLGKPLIAHVIERIRPQLAGPIAINANVPKRTLAEFGIPVIADDPPDFAGPLAGVLAGMRWAEREQKGLRAIVTVASDTPFFPNTLMSRLLEVEATSGQPLVCAASDGRTHPVFGLWPLALLDDLAAAVCQEEVRKVDLWTARHGIAVADWAVAEWETETLDPFFNLNRPEDFKRIEEMQHVAGESQNFVSKPHDLT